MNVERKDERRSGVNKNEKPSRNRFRGKGEKTKAIILKIGNGKDSS